ncbi:FAD-dependent oxidoreductase [Smaragdicoccus niigatensis]|uniref:FAD-dependent oxidoreductase n=1 Tax=Smaragdicoccus niigatensis TaxID=359359 RepID=UPI000367DBEB|nr:NAD(P)/FAD-dependent oxidoreductase [Smaragdicoccus niigatensis]
MTVKTALIIGGGIAGPVAACALQKAGVEARVFEAYAGPAFNIGSTLGFAPNGLAALDVIGAGDAVRAIALPMTHTVMNLGRKSVPLPALKDVEPLQVVDRSDLQSVLHDHAVKAGIEFEYNKRLVNAEENPDGVVAHFADGTSATADILIGADGIKSLVRTLIDPNAPDAEYTGVLGFGAYARIDRTLPEETMTFSYGKNAYYIYWTQPDGRVGWGANLPHRYLTSTQAREISAVDWLRILEATYGGDNPAGELIAGTDPADLVAIGGNHIMPPVPHWHSQRMVLVGDSVHAPSNSTGQGASLAIESAIQLARCLRDIDDPTTAFDTYERIRRPRVEGIAKRGKRINQTKTMGPIMRRTLPVLMPLATKMMKLNEVMSREQRYVIDWDSRVDEQAELAWV